MRRTQIRKRNKVKVNKFIQGPALPKEIIDRLQGLHNHATLPQQSMSFSVDLPAGNGRRLRWNQRFKQLPHPHIITTDKRGKSMSLRVLHQESGQVLQLGYENGQWRRLCSKPIRLAEKEVPNRHRHSNKRWFRKPATYAQQKMVGKIIGQKPEQLPPLTAYNAAVLIDTHRLMPHLRRIQAMVDLWLSEVGANACSPLLPFKELESA